jgi:hypothetical protein
LAAEFGEMSINHHGLEKFLTFRCIGYFFPFQQGQGFRIRLFTSRFLAPGGHGALQALQSSRLHWEARRMIQAPKYKLIPKSENAEESTVSERPMLRKRLRVGSAGILFVALASYIVWRSVLAFVGAAPSPNSAMNLKSVVNWNNVGYMFVL